MQYSWSDLTFRQCRDCGFESDNLEDFVVDPTSKYGRASWCKWCKNNKVVTKKSKNTRRDAIKQYINEFKHQPCSDCGKEYPSCVMDLHHIVPGCKEFAIARAATAGFNLESIKKELSKCIVLCSNCHRLRHYGEESNASNDVYKGGHAGI